MPPPEQKKCRSNQSWISPVTMVSVKTSASLVMISMIALMSSHTSSQPSPIYPNKNRCKSQTKEIAPIIYQNKSGKILSSKNTELGLFWMQNLI